MITPGSRLERFYRFVCGQAVAFKQCFHTPAGEVVLKDLAKFCFALAPTTTEREQGRRDVWLRIAQRINMHEEELAVLLANLTPEQRHQLWHPSNTFMEE